MAGSSWETPLEEDAPPAVQEQQQQLAMVRQPAMTVNAAAMQAMRGQGIPRTLNLRMSPDLVDWVQTNIQAAVRHDQVWAAVA
jgi:hypothetical protein